MNPAETFEAVCKHARETAMLSGVESLLGWDERTYMPPRAGAHRAEQITLLAGMLHRRRTDAEYGKQLLELAGSDLAEDPHSDSGTIIRMLARQFDKATKLPQTLVEELSRSAVLGQQAWVEARKNDDFAAFLPHLEKIVKLKQQEADALGHEGCRYDALLDDYEPGETTANVTKVLTAAREELAPLVAEIAASSTRPDSKLLTRSYPVSAQKKFGRFAAEKVGFDFERGRLDITHHPFCTEMGPHDCRITTRYDRRHFPGAFFGTLHEAGHGMYEQGLREEMHGLPPGLAVSLGIHESQSRMWENLVGRSKAFWKHFFPIAQGAFTATLGDVSLDDFYFAVNEVRPSLIRVEADEATYNLHIIIRFELEQALLSGDLPAADAADAWKEKYQQYLGIQPPGDADGVLQDVHWPACLIGYFPTYALGNLYAAQFFETAGKHLGDLDTQFAAGEFSPLLQWLRKNIHSQGQCYTAAELVQRVTGQPLSHKPLIASLRGKLAPLYCL